MQKMQATGGASPSPPALHSPQVGSPAPAAAATFSPNPYNMQQISPMMQMGMGINVGVGGSGQYGSQSGLHSQTQAMHQSVMRNPSPVPNQQAGQGYAGF